MKPVAALFATQPSAFMDDPRLEKEVDEVAEFRWNRIASAEVGKRERSNAPFARGECPTRSLRRHGSRGRVLGIQDPRCISQSVAKMTQRPASCSKEQSWTLDAIQI